MCVALSQAASDEVAAGHKGAWDATWAADRVLLQPGLPEPFARITRWRCLIIIVVVGQCMHAYEK